MVFHFGISGAFEQTGGCAEIRIKAYDYAHAMKQAKMWANRDGFTIVGNAKGYEKQVNW